MSPLSTTTHISVAMLYINTYMCFNNHIVTHNRVNCNTKMCFLCKIFLKGVVNLVNKKQRYYNRIKDLREDKDLTQAEIAKRLGLYTTQYQRYERAETTIPADIIVDIAKFHEVSTDYILGLTNDPTPSYKVSVKNQLSISGKNKIHNIEMK